MFVQAAAEIIGQVVFPVGKRGHQAVEAVHVAGRYRLQERIGIHFQEIGPERMGRRDEPVRIRIGENPAQEMDGHALEKEGIGYFPDAPTERGVRHIYELIDAREKGYECALAFVIQMPQVNEVRPNIQIQPEFGTAWNDALKAGVRIWFLGCDVTEEKLSINNSRVIVEL